MDEPRAQEVLRDDLAYQERILDGVSRTFALTIPLLPPSLCAPVGTAYLLCRIADTIEDSATLDLDRKRRFSETFQSLVSEDAPGEAFAASLAVRLGPDTLDAEKDLIANTPRVLRLLRAYDRAQREAIARCVRVMCSGMERFQEGRFMHGLPDLEHLSAYCYHVAGVVGEMLTDLFCIYAPGIAARRDRLTALAVPFGRGLQMTNILKDIWDDRRRGVCWLPRDVFARGGFDLDRLGETNPRDPAFETGLIELVGLAVGDLDRALEYALLIPQNETGIRQFCLWPVAMAMRTLRNIRRRPAFDSGKDVKIAPHSVRFTAALTQTFGHSNIAMRLLHAGGRIGLPHATWAP